MQLDDYLDFENHEIEPFGTVETIRIKGSRIGIEFIIQPFLDGESPERIYHGYRHSLSLEQVYAAITYYLHNKTKVEEYLKKGSEIGDYHYQEYLKKPPTEAMERIRKLKAERDAAKPS
ncbi:MAG: DUF433 domain-containing protein [Planctomycetes bacterium]|nr:DUF433 domain-containing protein [Planctomycetota bacterium]